MKHILLTAVQLGIAFVACFPSDLYAQTISAGAQHSLAICFDGSAMGWGNNGNGQLGNGSQTSSFTPAPVSNLQHPVALCAGGSHSLALDSLGQVWGWGLSGQGQVGNGSTQEQLVPQAVMDSAVAIVASSASSYALKSDGTVWAWGYGWYGQLGNGGGLDMHTPAQVLNLNDATAIAAGGGGGVWAMAMRADGTVVSWGHNSYGQLGNGTNNGSNTPGAIPGLNGVIAIAAGTEHGLALKSDGTLWAWGRNSSGALGNASNTDSNVPVQVSLPNDVLYFDAGENNSIAVTSDSTVWVWGGLNSSNVPVQVPGLAQVTEVSVGALHAFARRIDATIWTWGGNTYGQLGTGDQTSHATPVEVIGDCDLNAAIADGPEVITVELMPNPMVDHTTIRSTRTIGSFTLFDATGRIMDSGSVNASQFLLERGDLRSGVYHLVLRDATRSTTLRLVVQ